jgi:hypothetical protein
MGRIERGSMKLFARPNQQSMNLRHRVVHFRPADIYFPKPSKVLMELHNDEQLEGKVIDLSDSGTQKDAFAVIKIDRITQPVLVPVDRLEVMPVSAS